LTTIQDRERLTNSTTDTFKKKIAELEQQLNQNKTLQLEEKKSQSVAPNKEVDAQL
jgi:hypothetical protein